MRGQHHRCHDRESERALRGTGGPLYDHALTIASLRADAANYRAQTQRLRGQAAGLERCLSELLGQQVAADLRPARARGRRRA